MKRRAVSSRAAADEPPDEPLEPDFLARQSALEVIFERLPHALDLREHRPCDLEDRAQQRARVAQRLQRKPV